MYRFRIETSKWKKNNEREIFEVLNILEENSGTEK